MVGLGGDAPLMLGVLWSLSAITLVFVVLRFYTRIKIVQSYGMDDHFFNASFVSCARPSYGFASNKSVSVVMSHNLRRDDDNSLLLRLRSQHERNSRAQRPRRRW